MKEFEVLELGDIESLIKLLDCEFWRTVGDNETVNEQHILVYAKLIVLKRELNSRTDNNVKMLEDARTLCKLAAGITGYNDRASFAFPKIRVIKSLREMHNTGLLQAKVLVEQAMIDCGYDKW